MADAVLVAHSGKVRTLTLNRPDSLNALTLEMANLLADRLEEAAEDSGIRAVVITGAGKAFSSGGDIGLLQELLTLQPEVLRDPGLCGGGPGAR